MTNRRIAVLMTCHNRRATTLRCLRALLRQELPRHVALRVYVVDDGSTDGTSAAVRDACPEVHVLEGDGSLFWAGGMRRALVEARKDAFDYYLWLNDDTRLMPNAISGLLATCERVRSVNGAGRIVVGTTLDAKTHKPTYGGVARSSWWHPFRFTLLAPADQPVPCDTMNGNCVLICREVVDRIGNIDEAYQHGFGDYDYGLRAWRSGCTVWVSPGFVGWCRRTKIRQDWRNAELSWKQRWAAVVGPKGLPPRQMLKFARRHGGPFWPIFWCVPYLRALLLPTRRPPAAHTRTMRVVPRIALTGSDGERIHEA